MNESGELNPGEKLIKEILEGAAADKREELKAKFLAGVQFLKVAQKGFIALAERIKKVNPIELQRRTGSSCHPGNFEDAKGNAEQFVLACSVICEAFAIMPFEAMVEILNTDLTPDGEKEPG